MVDRDDILRRDDDDDEPTASERDLADAAKMDQVTAWLGDNLSPLWRRIYQSNLQQGFTPAESLKLVQCYILSQCPYGVRGTDA